MTIQRMDHVGIVVNDLPGAITFFQDLGLRLEGEATVEGELVDRIIGLEGVRSDIAMLETPDGRRLLELSRFHNPPAESNERNEPANRLGIRHLSFAVNDLDAALTRLRTRGVELVGEVVRYEDSYRLCYVRGPAGILIELAEELG